MIDSTLRALLSRAKTVAERVKSVTALTKSGHAQAENFTFLALDLSILKSLVCNKPTLFATKDPLAFESQCVSYGIRGVNDTPSIIMGTLCLSEGKPMHLPEFRRRFAEHGIGEDVRKALWPDCRRVYAYKILENTLARSEEVLETCLFINDLTPIDKQDCTSFFVKSAYCLRESESFIHDLEKFTTCDENLQIIQRDALGLLASDCEWLTSGYTETVHAGDATAQIGFFALLEKTLSSKRDTMSHLPLVKHVEETLLTLDRFDMNTITKKYWLNSDSEIGKLRLEKAEVPEGKLVSLKMPNPSWNLERLKEGKSTGLLTRLGRKIRVGVSHFLVNEISPEHADGSYIWGVITLKDAVSYLNLAAMPKELREGIDSYSLEEFSTESPVYYMEMELISSYDKPLKLAKPLVSRRFGPIISLPEDLAKVELVKAGPSQRYTPILPGSEGAYPELSLDEVLNHFGEEFLLRAPFVYLVGSTVNMGKTKNDVDVLIRGPLDAVTSHVTKFRLERMLPEELRKRIQFLGLEGEEIDAAGPFTAHIPLYDLVVRRREDYRAIIEMRDALGLEGLVYRESCNYDEHDKIQKSHLRMPREEKSWPAVFQAHFRGASVHGDLRFSQGDFLVGFTLAIQIAGKVQSPKNLEEAKRVAETFSMAGSSWNKPMIAPHRVFADTKMPEPEEWLNVEARAFKPGSVGATRNTWGYMVAIAKPLITRGVSEPYFTELFLERAAKFSGLLIFRQLVSDEGSPSDSEVEAGRKAPKGTPFWVSMFTESLLPSIIKKRSVDIGRIPPQGFSLLPPKLKAAIPKQWHYWKPTDPKERVGLRDELVKEGFFTETNIKLVDYQFQRVVMKYYLYTSQDGDGDGDGDDKISEELISSLEKRVGAQLWGSTAGKSRIANELVSMFPEHQTYVEPFAGGAACFYAKQPATNEVLSDTDKELMTAFKWVKSATDREIASMSQRNWVGSRTQFIRVAKTQAKTSADTFYKVAYLTYFAFMRNRHRLSAIDPSKVGVKAKLMDRIEEARSRLKGVKLFAADYKEVVKKFDGANTFFYLDPPYTKADAEVGEKNFNFDEFWSTVSSLKGKVLITFDKEPPKNGKWSWSKITHSAARGHEGGNKTYVTYAIRNYELPKSVKKAELSQAAFTLSWQKWKGQVVIRSAPSRNLYHLFIDRGDRVEDFQLLQDPFTVIETTAILVTSDESDAKKLLELKGDVKPGEVIGGLKLNETKDTPSAIEPLLSGEIEFLEDSKEFKKFKFVAKDLPVAMRAIYVLRKEGGDIWVYERSESPGVLIKEESIETITLEDGSKLENVQVWDPDKMKASDDKTHDRERLRPLSLYAPMKVAPRKTNEFRSGDEEYKRLLESFATSDMLKLGLRVEKKANGFRASLQKDADGRLLMLSEDIWLRKQPIVNYLTNLPGLKEELDKLPGPFILDGEFMAMDASGGYRPRRELAEFRSSMGSIEADSARVEVFDILYHPKKGNVMGVPLEERTKILDEFLHGKRTFIIRMPGKVVHTEPELKSAIAWARKLPGSEGAMLKYVDGTVTLKETDSVAKLKTIREVFGIVWDKHPVKGSPGVFNFMYAFGPLDKSTQYAELVEVDGKMYVKAGKTFNSKTEAGIGDVLRIEVTELLLDKSVEGKWLIRGFTPSVVDKVDSPASTMREIESLLETGEIKTQVSKRFKIIKSDEEHFVMGVVLEPEIFDAHEDIIDDETIRDACYYFMEKGHQIGFMHVGLLPSDKYRVLENFIAPVDFEINGDMIRKGTWMLGARILDETLWQDIKAGRITGWSIEGTSLTHYLE